jgi:hypothetical protein
MTGPKIGGRYTKKGTDDALLAIQEQLDGVEWTPDTLERIAEIMVRAGYRIRDLTDVDRTHPSERAVDQLCHCRHKQSEHGGLLHHGSCNHICGCVKFTYKCYIDAQGKKVT